MAMTVLIPTTLMANGMGSMLLSWTTGSSYSQPLVAETGCQIGLNVWYMIFSGLVFFKLLIEAMRYFSVKRYHVESIAFGLAGNFLVMPILFTAFFIYTQ